MSNKPFFSVVIPCCDIGPYVRECLESVQKQSFEDWECIAVVETSKDNTETIVRDIASGDSRFQVFTQPRSGSAGAARNTALNHARGEYVVFIDGDDSVLDGAFQRIHDKIVSNPGADIYPCASQVHYETSGKDGDVLDNYPDDAPASLSGPESIILIANRKWLIPPPWLSVFRREFLDANGLRFVPRLNLDDQEFAPRALYRASKVVPLHEIYYRYRIRQNSNMTEGRGWRLCKLKDLAVRFKSHFAFYAQVSREDNFDRRVAEAWSREWIRSIVFLWFDPYVINRAPIQERLDALNIMFADGFGEFDSLRRMAAPHRRITGWWVKTFVLHPTLRWAADVFFKVYFAVTKLKGR